MSVSRTVQRSGKSGGQIKWKEMLVMMKMMDLGTPPKWRQVRSGGATVGMTVTTGGC